MTGIKKKPKEECSLSLLWLFAVGECLRQGVCNFISVIQILKNMNKGFKCGKKEGKDVRNILRKPNQWTPFKCL